MTTGPEELSLNYLLDPAFQLVNTAGRPLTNGWIEVYYHGTRDKYYCASDFDGTLHPFKIPLDSLGSNIVLADPNFSYDIYVYNSFGSLQMSRYNVNPGSGSGGGSSGEGGPAEHWSSDTAGGASTTVTGGTTVYLTLPSSEDQPEFVDHTTDTAIFLKEGLYHIDAVVSFKQDDEDLQNLIKDLVVNTGLMGWDAQMTGQKNWTGPESTDDDRHFLELHTVVSVPEDLLQTLYFQISSPVDLDSAAIEKLDIIKLEAGGNGIKYTGGYGIDITGQVISVSGMMPEASAANFVDNSTYQVDIQNIYDTIAETSAMIPSGVATEQWVMEQGFITSADFPQTVPLVAGEGISIVDTSAYTMISCSGAGVSEEWVENYTSAFITSDALDDYVTDDEFSDVVNSLSDDIAAVSGAIPSLDGYATEQWVEDYTSAFITSADIPDVPEDLVTSAELATVSGNIVSQIPSLDGYATEQFVQDYTSAFITESDIPADLVTSGELATVSGDIMSQIPPQTTVSIDPTLSSGTKIADFSINGTSGELYAPVGGGSTYYAGDHIVIDQDNYISTSGLMEENSAFRINEQGYAERVVGSVVPGTLNLGTIIDNTPLQVIGLQDDVEYTLNCSGNTAGVQIYQGEQWTYDQATTLYPTNNEIKFTKSDFDNISPTGNYYLHFNNAWSPNIQGNTVTLSYEGLENERYALLSDIPSTAGFVTSGELATVSGLIEADIPSYTAGNNISIVSDEISVSDTAGLIAGDNVTITASGDNYVISSTGGGDVPADVVTSGQLATVSGQLSRVSTFGSTGWFPLETNYKSLRFNYGTVIPSSSANALRIVEVGNGSNYTTLGELVPVPSTSGLVLTSLNGSLMSWQEPSGGGGGLDQVYHDAGLTGLGTSESPLSITSADIWNSAAGMNEYPISAGPGMSIEDVDGVTVFQTSGTMMDDLIEYNSQDEISGYNGHPVMTVDSEKQWLTHDDTIAHVTNSAQYAFGVNVPVVAQAMGTDETVLYTGNGSSVVLSEVATNFEYLEITWEHKANASHVSNMVFKYEIPTTEFMGYGGRGQSQETGGFVWFIATWRLGSDNKTMTRWMSRYIVIGDSGIGTPTASNNLYPIKVVGIGRKENT